VLSTLENIATADFAHITYTEAIAILEKANRPFEFPVFWGADLQSEHERYLTEENVQEARRRHRLPERDQGVLHAPER